MTSFCRSQSGGQGKYAGRSMKRTMQRRNTSSAGNCWQRRVIVVATPYYEEEAWHRCLQHNGREQRTTGVGSTARVERAVVKVGKVSWVASALPHSEGVAYKRQGREVATCLRDWRMGS